MSDGTISTALIQTITLGTAPYLSAVYVTNVGTIMPSGTSGQAGIVIAAGGVTLINNGHISGATGVDGGRGINVIRNGWGTVVNYGIINGGDGEGSAITDGRAGLGGDGLFLMDSNVFNAGTLSGGSGQSVNDSGAGIYLGAGSGSNSGLILGGPGAGLYSLALTGTTETAAPAVVLVGGYFSNSGSLEGGGGAYADVGGAPLGSRGLLVGEQGGAGVVITGGAIMDNTSLGVVEGGEGGGGDRLAYGYGGPGGTGAIINGGTLYNAGTITGAPSSWFDAAGTPGSTGAGVIIQSGVLVDTGVISGATAVTFEGAGTLEVEHGATFFGDVIADLAAADVLELAGTLESVVTLGSSFQNFASVNILPGSAATIDIAAVNAIVKPSVTGLAVGDLLVLEDFLATTVAQTNAGIVVTDSAGEAETLAVGGYFGGATSYSLRFNLGAVKTTLSVVADGFGNSAITTLTGSATGVVLGSSLYADTLSIANTAVVYGSEHGGIGVTGDTVGVTLDNAGTIFGASASMSVLTGYVFGPAGREIPTYKDVDYSVGGDGISLVVGQILNSGDIFGAEGPSANDCGAGVYLALGTGQNSGLIVGGKAWGAQLTNTVVTTNYAAPGLALVGARFQNRGTILGGQGRNGFGPNPNSNIGSYGDQGGDGVILNQGAVLENLGLIEGGQGGVGGAGGYLPFAISYDINGGAGGQGGTGIQLDSGTIVNGGTILGGNGGTGGAANGQQEGHPGQMGIGVIVQEGLLINAGMIAGGADAVRFIGAGTLQVDAGGTFDGAVQAALGAGDVLALSGDTVGTIFVGQKFLDFATLDLSLAASCTVEGNLTDLATLNITGLNSTDTLDIYGGTSVSDSIIAGGGLVVTLDGSVALLPYVSALDGAALAAAPCFCTGTLIRTPRGKVAVEELRIGDEVCSASQGVQKVKWIGRRSYDARFIMGNHLAIPVCIRSCAIGDGIPSRNLWVSPDHAICDGGVLVPAWRLINGLSIVQPEPQPHIDYVHVELHGHHVIFAEDCPVESFRDADCRKRFKNAHEYETLYGDTESPPSCLPLVQGGFHLSNIRTRLEARAGLQQQALTLGCLRGNIDAISTGRLCGWAQDITNPEHPVVLHIYGDGAKLGQAIANEYRSDLRAARLGSGCHAFSFSLPSVAYTEYTVHRADDGAPLGALRPMAAEQSKPKAESG